MNKWLKRLLEDANGLPSSRLCISWILTGLVVWKVEILDDTKLGLLLTAITTMTSVSVIDKVKQPIQKLIEAIQLLLDI